LQEPRFERGLDWLEPVDGYSAFDKNAVDFGDDLAPRARRQRDPQPQRRWHGLDAGTEGGAREQGTGPAGFGAFDLKRERRPRQQLGDRSLLDDAAAVHDGDSVAGPLHLVEEVGGQHDCAALGHHRKDHVAHLSHSGRVEPVHRLVQKEQLRVSEQARGDAQRWRIPIEYSETRSSARWARPARSSAGPMRSRAAGSNVYEMSADPAASSALARLRRARAQVLPQPGVYLVG
jgi:hypothetical protein